MHGPTIERDGFCVLLAAVEQTQVRSLLEHCRSAFADDSEGVLARSSRGHVYAARNLIRSVPNIHDAWRNLRLCRFLETKLGMKFGLVRLGRLPGTKTLPLPYKTIQNRRLISPGQR